MDTSPFPAAETRPSRADGRAARLLLRAHRYGALSTLSKKFDGHPFGSITPYLTDHDGSLLILISDLAEHSKNIRHDARVSLITHNQEDPHIQTQGRVTVVGMACAINERNQAATRWLRYFPEAETYLAMSDFNFFRIQPQAIRYIGGFGDIHWVERDAYLPQQRLDASRETALLEQLNAIRPPSSAQLVGIDCDGYDLRLEARLVRHNFAEVLTDEAAIVSALTG